MSSIADKIKSKIKPKVEISEGPTTFDETNITISLSQGKSQLTEIKVLCHWKDKYMANRYLRLKCRWYNKTQNNLQQIIGLERDSYQPSVLDVGTIIRIQIEPQSQGLQYIGMPMVLESNPISLAQQTEAQANSLLKAGNARFIAEVKEARIKDKKYQFLGDISLKFRPQYITLSKMQFSSSSTEQTAYQIKITESYPQFVIARNNFRELLIQISPNQYYSIFVNNHKVRDVVCLLHKLMVISLLEQQPVEDLKVQRQLFVEENEVNSQITKIQKLETSQKQSVSEILNLSNVKLEMRRVQGENILMKKEIDEYKDKIIELSQKLGQEKERLDSITKNYFTIEQELKEMKQKDNGYSQEIIYYRKQNKILSDQNKKFAQNLNSVKEKLQKYQSIQNIIEQTAEEIKLTYAQLQLKLKLEAEAKQELQLKYEYILSEKQNLEEQIKDYREKIELFQSQKMHIEKKYESLVSQMSNSPLRKSKTSESSIEAYSLPSLGESINLERNRSNISIENQRQYFQKQILDLKCQLKEVIEQNNYLRSLSVKDKKPSSKTQIKLQLFEVRKLANRLAEALTQKEMSIQQLKNMNKELNQRLLDEPKRRKSIEL